MNDEILSVTEARAFLRERTGLDIPEWRVYQHVRTGVFPAGEVVLREGRTVWLRRSGLERWLERGGAGLPRPAA